MAWAAATLAYLMSQNPDTQVEQHEPSSCDIKLDLSVVRSYETMNYMDHQGEWNILIWFLKNTQ